MKYKLCRFCGCPMKPKSVKKRPGAHVAALITGTSKTAIPVSQICASPEKEATTHEHAIR